MAQWLFQYFVGFEKHQIQRDHPTVERHDVDRATNPKVQPLVIFRNRFFKVVGEDEPGCENSDQKRNQYHCRKGDPGNPFAPATSGR